MPTLLMEDFVLCIGSYYIYPRVGYEVDQYFKKPAKRVEKEKILGNNSLVRLSQQMYGAAHVTNY
jgi:hypothetical protein